MPGGCTFIAMFDREATGKLATDVLACFDSNGEWLSYAAL